jgi:hypothetical protein
MDFDMLCGINPRSNALPETASFSSQHEKKALRVLYELPRV